jgi:glutaredoxin 2
MIYGLKNIRHDLIWLQNDDKETPSAMHPQNKKVLPIVDKGGEILIESLDIVKAVDEDPAYGSPVLKPATGRTDIDEWVKSTKSLMGKLSRPRYIQTYLPEFAFKSARDMFVLNHPIDKTKYSKGDEGIFEEYKEALAQSDELLAAANEKIQEVVGMIDSVDSVSPGGLSYDDITFFARFRGFTVIKGLKLGPKLSAYLENMAAKSEIPLLTGMAV